MREDSGVAAGLFSLPSGGGGIAPLGDRFEPDLVRGSGSYAVPIQCPQGPNGLRPALSLAYSTGAGNGPFGLGWRLGSLRIERASDRGVPRYGDDDTFTIGDAEELVPVGDNRYRPKSDTKFWLIERTGESWKIRSGEGRTLLLGSTPESRESNGDRTFAWYLDEERDNAGNSISYSYLRDRDRLYLQDISYSIFHLKLQYEVRPDSLRNGRAGFERITALRAKSIELQCDRVAPTLMRTYSFEYAAALNGASLLKKLSLTAEQDGEKAGFPDLSFEYSGLDLQAWKVHEMQALVPPPTLDDKNTQLVDMTGDGLPDVLQTAQSRTYLWRNSGDGWMEGPVALDGVPSTLSLDRANVAIADLRGNGRGALFAVDQPLAMAFEVNGRGGFSQQPVVFRDGPTLRLAAADTRLMDIDGDGVTDLISTGRDNLLLFRHEAGIGWTDPQPIQRIHDLDQFPDVGLADRGVHLADMSGDGLQDLVAVRSGDVSWWPYYGNGKWGPKVEMDESPRFPEGYRDDRVLLMDIDGDGCTDIVYMDSDRSLIWINQSGTAFSDVIEVPISLGTRGARVLIADMFGDGRPGLAWSQAANVDASAGYRFLRFDAGRAPYLLTAIDNGMGGSTEMAYSNTTQMRLQDRAAGRDWPGQMPFVVQVVERISERDQITGRVSERTFRYHNGVYDGLRREFRGFTTVTAELNGDDSIPAGRQEFDYFQGDPEAIDLVQRARERSLAGALIATRLYEPAGGNYRLRSESTQQWDARSEHEDPQAPVFFPYLTSIETREHSINAGVLDRIERVLYSDYDEHGNAGRRNRESLAEGDAPGNWIRSEERYQYTKNTVDWLVRLPVRTEVRDGAGALFAVKIQYFDGADFTGLAEGLADKGLLTRVQELRLFQAKLPPGYIGDRDMTALGYQLQGAGDTLGYYATTMSVRRDSRGNIVEQRDPLGAALKFTYDPDGVFPMQATDAVGNQATVVFDARAGEPSLVTYPDGRRVRYEHDAIGRLTASFETDDSGNEQLVKRWVLDLTTRPSSVTSVAPNGGERNSSEFGPETDFAALDDVVVSRTYYDGMGKPALQISTAPDGPGGTRRFLTAKRTEMNARLMPAAEFLPEFVTNLEYFPFHPVGPGCARMRYDAEGSKEETAGPGAVHQRVVRDNFTITHYDGAGAGGFGTPNPPGPPTRTEWFDARNRLFRIQEAKGGGEFITTTYDLTLDGHIEVVRDNAGAEVTRYTFAGPDNIVQIVNRDAGTRTYYRDAAGHLVERVSADGKRVFYNFDVLGRMTRIESGDGGARELLRELVYDDDPGQPTATRFLKGRVAMTREPGYEIHYSYNRAGKIVNEETTAGGVKLATGHEYTLQGRLQAITYPDGFRLDYTLDRSGFPSAIPGILSGVTYDADGAVTSYVLSNGVEVAMPRETDSRRISETAARKNGATLRSVAYDYDSVGNIIAMRDEMPDSTQYQTFGYDGLYRLAEFQIRQDNAQGALTKSGNYTYDASGNLLRLEEAQPLTLSYADASRPGRLTSVFDGGTTQALSYDARGHLSAMGDLKTFEFDALDRLVRVVKADGTELRMTYDPQGRRILKQVTKGGISTNVRYASGLFEQFNSQAIRHVFLASGLVASITVKNSISKTAYYLTDHHGSILLATDEAGGIVDNQRYSPFGLTLTGSSLARYLGRERDVETGLLQLGVRYYAPPLGRFISPDWFVLENPSKPARMPQGFNVYSYAINNPLVFKDPSGMWFFIVLAIAFAVGFIAGTIYGLANGQGWKSLLTGLETGLATAAGFALGAGTGYLLGLGLGGGAVALAGIGGAMGGLNGMLSGMHGIYDWEHPGGWFAFLADSTWGLLGTSLGNIVQVMNMVSGAKYRDDLSRRQNRNVYEGGFYIMKDDAFTQGNVISNAGLGGRGVDMNLIDNHESIHILQNRIFGPLFQVVYVVWLVGGFIVGSVFWLFHTDHSWGDLVETAAYFDNPWEYWAYSNQNYWQPTGQKGFDPIIAWG
ncbi:MAG: FG-GAP-like repeat-containing protein [Acidobacteriia bacterium]|nr:FG-GAP-like repeat-containing protein [Terriglobia bacterium]